MPCAPRRAPPLRLPAGWGELAAAAAPGAGTGGCTDFKTPQGTPESTPHSARRGEALSAQPHVALSTLHAADDTADAPPMLEALRATDLLAPLVPFADGELEGLFGSELAQAHALGVLEADGDDAALRAAAGGACARDGVDNGDGGGDGGDGGDDDALASLGSDEPELGW